MEPLYLTEMNVIPLSALYFKLPESEYGREDISITIEYCRSDIKKNQVHCWAWAQVGDAFLRGLVDEYTVPYMDDKDRLDESIIYALNNSKRFKESLPGFITSVIALDPDALQ